MARSIVVAQPLQPRRFYLRRLVLLERRLVVSSVGLRSKCLLRVQRANLWIQWFAARPGNCKRAGDAPTAGLLRRRSGRPAGTSYTRSVGELSTRSRSLYHLRNRSPDSRIVGNELIGRVSGEAHRVMAAV